MERVMVMKMEMMIIRMVIRRRTSLWMELIASLLHRTVILSDLGSHLCFFSSVYRCLCLIGALLVRFYDYVLYLGDEPF